jgi:hypothetical protein
VHKLIIAGLLMLTACNKNPQPSTNEPVALSMDEEKDLSGEMDDIKEAEPLPDIKPVDEPLPLTKEMQDQKEADEIESGEIMEYVNANAINGLLVVRDRQTGCEFIATEHGLTPRPNGETNPYQRGCGTGTDFKK